MTGDETPLEMQAMRATSYPWWVIAFGAAVLLAFGYSLLSLPHHIFLARELAAAKRLDAAGDYPGAEKHYSVLLADMPGSKPARLGMAHALFADHDEGNDPAGLALLTDLTIDDGEWAQLQPVMPQAYQSLFVVEKR